MRKLSTILIVLLIAAVQNYSNAEIYAVDHANNFDYLAYSYDDILAYSTAMDNIYMMPSSDAVMMDINSDMAVSKIIDEDFSLEMDLDAKAKKQLKPKSTVIEGYKYDAKSSKCVEKVMKPHLKKYKVQEEVIGDEIDNIDVDKLTDTDIKQEAKKQRSERIAKAKKQKQLQKQAKERVAWFNFFKRNKTEQRIAKNETPVVPDIADIDNSLRPKKQAEQEQSVNTKNLADNTDFDVDKSTSKPVYNQPKVLNKKEEARIARENLKLAKPEKQKPVKVAKVTELKPIKPEKAEKTKDVKPVKVAKVTEPKPIKPEKVEKAKEVKPVKVAKVTEPKPIKPEKAEKAKEVKPVKVAKVTEPKPIKPEKAEKTKEVKPVKVAKVTEPKPIKPEKVAVANVTPTINNAVFRNATYNSALGKPVPTKFESVPTDKQISTKIGRGIIIPKPLKTPKATAVAAKTSQPAVAKTVTPALTKAETSKIASNQTQVVKAVPIQPVKKEQVSTTKVADIKPVVVSKPAEVKPVVKTEPTKVVSKPAEVKPVVKTEPTKVVSKPAEVKPVVKTEPTKVVSKPAEVKPVVKTEPTKVVSKPAEVKPVVKTEPAKVVSKPAEVKPVVKTEPTKVASKPAVVKPVQTSKPQASVGYVTPKKETISPVVVAAKKTEPINKVEPVKQSTAQSKQVVTQVAQSGFKPIKVEQKSVTPAVQTASVQQPRTVVKSETGFKPVKVENKELSNIAVKKEEAPVQTYVQKPAQTQTAYHPVSAVSVPVIYNLSKPQETPVYSAFETMQNRIPRATKPFDTDDM